MQFSILRHLQGEKGKKSSAHKKSNVRSAFQCQHLSLILSKNPEAKQWKVLILKSVPGNMLFLCDEKSTGGLVLCTENIQAHPLTETEHKSQIFYLNFIWRPCVQLAGNLFSALTTRTKNQAMAWPLVQPPSEREAAKQLLVETLSPNKNVDIGRFCKTQGYIQWQHFFLCQCFL